MPLCCYHLCNKGFIGRHGNRKYCSHRCYYEQKKERSIDIYQKHKDALSGMKQTEASLNALFKTHGENNIPYSIHNEYNIDWGFFNSIKEIEGIKYRIAGNFGYIRFSDHSIKIKKIN
jgi:hypothetical protein